MLVAFDPLICKTEWWKIRFKTTEEFDVVSSYTGLSQTGNINSEFLDENNRIRIKKEYWVNNFQSDDEFYFATYQDNPTIVTLAIMLAVSYGLQSQYTEEVPNASDYGKLLFDQVRDWIDDYREGTVNLVDSTELRNACLKYEVNKSGTLCRFGIRDLTSEDNDNSG